MVGNRWLPTLRYDSNPLLQNALRGGFQLQGEIYEVTMGRPIFDDPQLPCLKATRPNPPGAVAGRIVKGADANTFFDPISFIID